MKYIDIFVYGSLKRGYHNHDYFCQNMINCIQGTVIGQLYDTGYGFPALDLNGNNVIYGQLITIPQCDLPAFDRLQGVPHLYQRSKINVKIKDQTKQAFVYHIDCKYRNFKIVSSGKW